MLPNRFDGFRILHISDLHVDISDGERLAHKMPRGFFPASLHHKPASMHEMLLRIPEGMESESSTLTKRPQPGECGHAWQGMIGRLSGGEGERRQGLGRPPSDPK
jgi:hypothetical protein